jgi:hypothetical protein
MGTDAVALVRAYLHVNGYFTGTGRIGHDRDGPAGRARSSGTLLASIPHGRGFPERGA